MLNKNFRDYQRICSGEKKTYEYKECAKLFRRCMIKHRVILTRDKHYKYEEHCKNYYQSSGLKQH